MEIGAPWRIRLNDPSADYCSRLFICRLARTTVCNKTVLDCRLRSRCCHLESYFKHTPFCCRYIRRDIMCRGVAKGGVLGPPNPIPLKLLRIKRIRTRHALRIRLIELWMSWMNWELRSINCCELVGYFGLQVARLCKNLVLRWRHLYRVQSATDSD